MGAKGLPNCAPGLGVPGEAAGAIESQTLPEGRKPKSHCCWDMSLVLLMICSAGVNGKFALVSAGFRSSPSERLVLCLGRGQGGSGDVVILAALLGLPWGSPEHSEAIGSGLMAMLGLAQTSAALYPPDPCSSPHHICCQGCAKGSWWDKTVWMKGIARLQGRARSM